MTPNATPARSRWPLILLLATIAWLWWWTLFAYFIDLPRQIYLEQRLGVRGVGEQLLFEHHLWLMAGALVFAVVCWFIRPLRVLGAMGLIAVPAILLMGLYMQMGLRPDQTTALSKFIQDAHEKMGTATQTAPAQQPVK